MGTAIVSTSCRSYPCPALTLGQYQTVTPLRDVAEQPCLGQGVPWHLLPWFGLLPAPGEKGPTSVNSQSAKAPSAAAGRGGGSYVAWSRAWAGLGAGPNPPDPRPHGSSHIPGTPPQGLLRPAGSARAQKGREGVRWRMLRALGTRGGQTRAQSLARGAWPAPL